MPLPYDWILLQAVNLKDLYDIPKQKASYQLANYYLWKTYCYFH